MSGIQTTLDLTMGGPSAHCIEPVVLHLPLMYHWYDETELRGKRIEYREMTDRWWKLIWQKREELTHVRFSRGYTRRTLIFKIDKIDIGPCPIEGWGEEYYRIHFS